MGDRSGRDAGASSPDASSVSRERNGVRGSDGDDGDGNRSRRHGSGRDGSDRDGSRRASSRWLPTVLRIAGTAAGFAWIAMRVSPSEIADAFARIPIAVFGFATLLVAANVVAGALRWRVLLRAYGASQIPPTRLLVERYFVAFFYNNYLPGAVVGDVARGIVTREAFAEPTGPTTTRTTTSPSNGSSPSSTSSIPSDATSPSLIPAPAKPATTPSAIPDPVPSDHATSPSAIPAPPKHATALSAIAPSKHATALSAIAPSKHATTASKHAGTTGSLAVVLVERALGLFALFALLAIGLLGAPASIDSGSLWLWTALGMLGSTVLVVCLPVARRIAPRLPGPVGRVAAQVPALVDGRAFGVAIVYSVTTQALIACAGWILLAVFTPLSLGMALLVVPLAAATTFLPITVGGAGAREAVYVALCVPLFGMPEADALAASLGLWLAHLVVGAIGGGWQLVRRRA